MTTGRVGPPQIPPSDIKINDDKGIMNTDWYLFFNDFFSQTGAAGRQYPIWTDMEVAASAMRIPASGIVPTIVGSTIEWDASAVTVNVDFSTTMPRSYNEETPIYPFVVWSPQDATAGGVVWDLNVQWVNNGDVVPSATVVTMTDSVVSTTSGRVYRTVATTPLPGSGQRVNSTLICGLTRTVGAVADTYTGEVQLTHVGFQHERNLDGTTSR